MSIVDDIENALQLVEATAEQAVARLATIGNWGTAGPELDDHPLILTPAPSSPAFVDGWWSEARRVDPHPGRVGPPIAPIALGVHSTDMPPEDWDPLVNAWRTRAGDGACCNFLLGRTEAHGVLQFISALRNGQHMGGPGHGVFVVNGQEVHPNALVVGVELHCAGGVRRIGNKWRFVENGVIHGDPLPDAEVIPDPQRPGRGWHTITDYQRTMLARLRLALEPILRPLPAGTKTRAFGEVPPAIAVMPTARLVTHWQMDPEHRADPWPPTCEWLRGLVKG